jgi:hypothetical protein
MLGHGPPSGDEIVDQDYQRDYKQKVDEAATEVQRETEKPQDEQHNDDSPKNACHVRSLLVVRIAVVSTNG